MLLASRRDKEVAGAARFCKASQKENPGSKGLDEEENKRQGAITQMEKVRCGLLETTERKQKLRVGATKESEEAFFPDIKV